LVFPVLALSSGAFFVWLCVRFVNRRERWAKRAVLTLVAMAALYPLSFGPAVWLTGRDWISVETLSFGYGPMAMCFNRSPSGLRSAMIWCWNLGGASDIELFFLLSDGQHDIRDPDNWSGTSGRETGRN
jgi:hypothetical protein